MGIFEKTTHINQIYMEANYEKNIPQ
jgi:hypothetical protein